MSDNQYPNEHDKFIARTGLMIQFGNTNLVKTFPGTIDECIDHYQLREFIENTILVIATEKMWHRISVKLFHESVDK